MPDVWGPDEVIAHLRKVYNHFKVPLDVSTNAQEVLRMLETYDAEVEAITLEQGDAVSNYIIEAIKRIEVRKAAEADYVKKQAANLN